MESSISRNGSSISEVVPDPILHQILSLLSQKEAVRTCVLTKSWRHLWYARPQISFRTSDFVCTCSPPSNHNLVLSLRRCLQERKDIFRLALEKTLQRYHHQKLSIENIELEMFEVDPPWISLLEKWIPIFIAPDTMLETLSLCFSRPCSSLAHFDLPSVVFQVKSLKKLCLERCNINVVNPTSECLQTLSLKNVSIEVDTLEMLLSSCPLIESLVLKECLGLTAPNVIRIKHTNLKHFSFHAYLERSYQDSPGIEIDAPNLLSLYLREVQLYTDYFKDLSSKFPRLEDLSVLWCKGHGELKLSSRSMKSLYLSSSRERIEATIDAPNLHDFKFTGEFPETSLTFTPPTWSEWKSHVDLEFLEEFFDGDVPWFCNLSELLRSLSKSQISLDASFNNLPDIEEEEEEDEGGFNHERVVVVESLRLHNYGDACPTLPRFLNGLFRVCRPRYTLTLFDEDNKLFHFLCKVLVLEREKRDYFWQKDLEQVDVQVLNNKANEWNPTSLPDCENLPSKQDMIRFQLKWSD